MYEGQRRMGGKFITVPLEVMIELKKLTPGAESMYTSLLTFYVIQENWDTPSEWVEGALESTKAEMIRRAGLSEGWFYQKQGGWQSLVKAGLVVDAGGKISLPKFKKKSDAFISPSEIRQLRADLALIKSIIFDEKAEIGNLFSVGLSEKTKRLTTAKIAEITANFADISANIAGTTSFKGPKERDIEEEEDRAREDRGVDNLVEKSGQNPVGSADWIRDLIINLWPGRGYREEDEDFVSKFAGGDTEKILEAFAAAKKQRNVKRLSWIENRLDDPQVYKGAADGRKQRKNLRSGEGSKAGGRRSGRGDQAGEGRVDREEWPEVE